MSFYLVYILFLIKTFTIDVLCFSAGDCNTRMNGLKEEEAVLMRPSSAIVKNSTQLIQTFLSEFVHGEYQ